MYHAVENRKEALSEMSPESFHCGSHLLTLALFEEHKKDPGYFLLQSLSL